MPAERAPAERARAASERAGAEQVLRELLALERELLELSYVRRSDALERASDAARALGPLTGTAEVLTRAAAELGRGSELHRVLISEVHEGLMVPLTIWARAEQPSAEAALARLAETRIALDYPLIEHEVVRRRGAEIVSVATAGARAPAVLAETLCWDAYAVAALTVGGETIGLLHADATAGGRPLDALDAEVVGTYAHELSGVLERAVLRHTLDLHRAELAGAVHWMSARLGRLEDAAALVRPGPVASADAGAIDALTARELDVLRLLARGRTNHAIATALVVREGTVKYHVKNILRKLGAANRADAVARFVRATEAGAGR